MRLLPGGARSDAPRRVLVIRLGNVGDIVVALPAFHALRRLFPEAHMTLLTSPTRRGAPGATELLAADPTFDDMIVYYEDESADPGFLRRLRADLRARRVDLAVVLPDDLTTARSTAKYIALLAASGVRHVAGARLVRPEERDTGQTPRLMHIVSELGPAEIEPFPWLRLSEEDHQAAADLLRPAGGAALVGMQTGAKRPANRWAPDSFIEAGRRLADTHSVRIVLTGGPDEREVSARVAEGIGPAALDLAGRTTLTQLAAVVARCRVFVSNDTGPMHLAAAMGTPVVAIFSARDRPFRWHPAGEGHRVLRRDIACAPCLRDVCPLYPYPECLRLITPGEVVAAAGELLAESGETP
jgi:heptosyltransferase III